MHGCSQHTKGTTRGAVAHVLYAELWQQSIMPLHAVLFLLMDGCPRRARFVCMLFVIKMLPATLTGSVHLLGASLHCQVTFPMYGDRRLSLHSGCLAITIVLCVDQCCLGPAGPCTLALMA